MAGSLGNLEEMSTSTSSEQGPAFPPLTPPLSSSSESHSAPVAADLLDLDSPPLSPGDPDDLGSSSIPLDEEKGELIIVIRNNGLNCPSDILHRFQSFLLESRHCDLLLVSSQDGTGVRTHSAFLSAQSEVLNKFCHTARQYRNRKRGRMQMHALVPVDKVRGFHIAALVQYLYFGGLRLPVKEAVIVNELARFFDIAAFPDLKNPAVLTLSVGTTSIEGGITVSFQPRPILKEGAPKEEFFLKNLLLSASDIETQSEMQESEDEKCPIPSPKLKEALGQQFRFSAEADKKVDTGASATETGTESGGQRFLENQAFSDITDISTDCHLGKAEAVKTSATPSDSWSSFQLQTIKDGQGGMVVVNDGSQCITPPKSSSSPQFQSQRRLNFTPRPKGKFRAAVRNKLIKMRAQADLENGYSLKEIAIRHNVTCKIARRWRFEQRRLHAHKTASILNKMAMKHKFDSSTDEDSPFPSEECLKAKGMWFN